MKNTFFTISKNEVGLRIDKFLITKGLVFSLVPKLIRKKLIKVNNQKTEISYRLQVGDEIEIFTDLNFKEKIKNYKQVPSKVIDDFKKLIIYQDENIIAINKTSGLAVQGGTGISFAIDDILPYLKFDNEENPKLVHRLDKDTSGILLIARNRSSADLLSLAFKEKTIKKTYLALVKGIPKQGSGTIDMPLLKKYQGQNEKVYHDKINGKQAVTHYKLIKSYPDKDISLLELRPETGRTHQIRVHLKEIGYPVIGDFKYGSNNTNFEDLQIAKRLYLHAYKIEMDDFFGKDIKINSHENIKERDLLKVFL